MYHRLSAIHFQCTGCGRCCFGNDDHFIHVNDEEAERIRSHLGISWDWFRRRYQVRLDHGAGWGVRLQDGRCVFLDSDLRCSIYAVRPTQCRTYPYWPEVLRSRGSWRAEAKRCEGIGRGDSVDVRLIENQLRLQIESESADS